MQNNADFGFTSSGNLLKLPDVKDDATEDDLLRSFEGAERVKRNGVVSEIKRKGSKHLITVIENIDEEKQESEEVVYEVKADLELNVQDGDVLKAGSPLTKGELLGKGNPFLILPLYFRYRRFYNSTEGKCSSIDGIRPNYIPKWADGNKEYTCRICSKKQYETIDSASGERKCTFSVVMTFLGGSDLSTLYKVTLRSTNLGVYQNKIFKVLRSVGFPHSVIFLFDTIQQESADKKHKWWIYDSLDVCKTPTWLLPHAEKAKAIIDKHYQDESESVGKNRAAGGRQGFTQQSQAPAADEGWGDEFEDKPPF
jgi:hypothetical protein